MEILHQNGVYDQVLAITTSLEQQTMTEDNKGSHLFVLIHGLWGAPGHMNSLEQVFKDSIDPKEDSVFFSPTQNEMFKTFDGIEIIGYRVLIELCQFILNYNKKNEESGKRIRKISIIGYSLGGLVSRFVIGKLYTECIEYFHDIEPVLFLTMASPHIGVHFYNPLSSPLKIFLNPILTFFGSTVLGRSGREMFIAIGSGDLLVKLSEGDFIEGLAKFKHRVAFANVKNDRTVAFYTAFITDCDPFIDTDNSITYEFETKVPGSKYSRTLPKIVDMTRLDPHNKRILEDQQMTILQRLRFGGFILLALVFVFPIALIVNISGTIFRHFATIKYRTMLSCGDFQSDFRKKIGITDQVRSYVQGTYESMLNPNNNDDETESDSSKANSDSITANEDTVLWNSFIDKYSSISDNTADNKWKTRFRKLPFNNKRKIILTNLSKLKWIRVPIYVKSFNAHGSIVARAGMGEQNLPSSIASVEFAGQLVNHLVST